MYVHTWAGFHVTTSILAHLMYLWGSTSTECQPDRSPREKNKLSTDDPTNLGVPSPSTVYLLTKHVFCWTNAHSTDPLTSFLGDSDSRFVCRLVLRVTRYVMQAGYVGIRFLSSWSSHYDRDLLGPPIPPLPLLLFPLFVSSSSAPRSKSFSSYVPRRWAALAVPGIGTYFSSPICRVHDNRPRADCS